jgi:hypothetical protein
MDSQKVGKLSINDAQRRWLANNDPFIAAFML